MAPIYPNGVVIQGYVLGSLCVEEALHSLDHFVGHLFLGRWCDEKTLGNPGHISGHLFKTDFGQGWVGQVG